MQAESENKTPRGGFKLFHCPSCSSSFNSSTSEGVLRVPHLLECGHRICSQCLIKKQKNGCISCGECRQTTEKHSSLLMDSYVLGLMCGKKHQKAEESIEVSKNTQVCWRCKEEAWRKCDKCDKIICDLCFKTSHDSDYWQDHKLVDLVTPSAGSFSQLFHAQFCCLHDDNETVYCIKCKKRICLRCNRSCSLQKHPHTTIKAKNVSKIQKVKDFSKTTSKLIDRHFLDLKELQESKVATKASKLETRDQIDFVIADYISFFQVLGAELKREADEVYTEFIDKLDIAEGLVIEDIKKLQSVQSSLEFVIENVPETNLYEDILENFKENLHSVRESLDHETLKPKHLVLEFDEDMKKSAKRRAKLREIKLAAAVASKKLELTNLPAPTQPITIKKTVQKPSEEEKSLESCWSSEEDDLQCQFVAKNFKENSSVDVTVKPNPNAVPKLPAHTSKVNSENWSSTRRKFDIAKHEMFQYRSFTAEITHFDSLFSFYVRQVDQPFLDQLKQLEDAMMKFYSENRKQILAVKPYIGYVGAVLVDGVWRRCKMASHCRQKIEVFLVDVGRKVVVEHEAFYQLHPKFLNVKQAAIHCCLGDVKPKPEHNSLYPERAGREFKKLLMESNFEINVMIRRVVIGDSPAQVIVYFYPNSTEKFNFNAMLVNKFDCAVSTGEDSEAKKMVTKDVRYDSLPFVEKKKKLSNSNGDLKKKRISVEFLKIYNPGEFYVALKHREDDYKELQKLIQLYAVMEFQVKKLTRDSETTWELGDFCFAQHTIDFKKNPEWFRGQITSSSEVFLIDLGRKIKLELDFLLEMPQNFSEIPPAAIKMHNHCAAPTGGGQWTISSTDEFLHIVNKFSEKCVSVVGDKNRNESIPVIVWGITTQESVMVTQTQFYNVSEYLFTEGFLDRTLKTSVEEMKKLERFVTDDFFGWEVEEEVQEDTKDLESNDSDKSIISEWLPPNPCGDSVTGVVTSVDFNDGTIYIRDKTQEMTYQMMKENIKNVYGVLESEDREIEIKKGQPVIVFNKFDGEFYRGLVESLKTNKKGYKIRFVDIGSVDLVERKEIFAEVIAADIPVQVYKFQLCSVVPLNQNDKKWPKTTLEFIYDKFVDQEVKVLVKNVKAGNADVMGCSIKSLEEVLIEKGFARRRKSNEIWSFQVQSLVSDEEVEEFNVEEIKRQKKEKETEDLIGSFFKPATVDVSFEEMKKFLKATSLSGQSSSIKSASLSVKSSFVNFEPKKVSSPIPDSLEFEQIQRRNRFAQRLEKNIDFFDLKAEEIDQFECKYSSLYNGLVYIKPLVDSLLDKEREMEKFLSEIDFSMTDKFSNRKRAVSKLCIVDTDSGWKRGVIENLIEETQEFQVFFIDSGVVEFFEFDKVRKMLMALRKFPRIVLPVEIYGVSKNVSVSEEMVSVKLVSAIEGKIMKAFVRSYSSDDIPQVELFDKTGALAYQALIDKKYYLRNLM